jgi:hypothetical protein
LGKLTADYYAPCKHRVVAPEQPGERIGLHRVASQPPLLLPAATAAHRVGRGQHPSRHHCCPDD